MEYYSLPQTNLKVSKVALGCMRIASKTPEEVENLVLESLKAGINFFDHADIYGGGKSAWSKKLIPAFNSLEENTSELQ